MKKTLVNRNSLIILIFLICSTVGSYSQSTIYMKKEGGVFLVPCRINGLSLDFIFDTGASSVSISSTEALFMLKNGYLTNNDFIGKVKFSDATGNISEGTKIIIRKIEFNGISIYNVPATVVHNIDAPLLLGQSAMAKIGSFQLDPNTGALTINNAQKSYNFQSNNKYTPEQIDQKISTKNGYQIKVKFNDVQDSWVYLCHYFGKSTTVFKDDSMKLSKTGEVVFKSDKRIIGGIYMLLFADKSASMEMILKNGDNFALNVTKSDINNTATFLGETENIGFYDYQRFLSNYGKEYQKIEAELVDCKNKADTTVVYDKLKVKGKELIAFRANSSQKNPSTFLRKLFDAVDEPEIPTELPILADGKKDSSYPRIFYKSHYWDKYDFRDDRLIYTPLYERKLEDYMTKLVIPVPDSVKAECDALLNECKGMEETFKYTLWYLTRWTETSKVMGLDEAFVHLVENYYMKGMATWIDSAQLSKYVKRAGDIAPNMIGKPAMDLRMLDTSAMKVIPLSSVKAKYTVVIFWSPTCGHCQKEMPQFDSLYKAALKKYDVKMYAVEADNETEKWKTYINEHKLSDGWIHVSDPQRTTKFRDFYDVYSTPTIYLLDEQKIIRGKRIDHTNLLGLIDWLEKKKKTASSATDTNKKK